jgi:hypothetical protein
MSGIIISFFQYQYVACIALFSTVAKCGRNIIYNDVAVQGYRVVH